MFLQHVCRNGRPEFKKDIGRNLEPIKECLQFKGPPDPLRGDEIYKRVRDLAKETLEAIFDSQAPVVTSSVAASNRIQGIGGGDVMEPQHKYKSSTLSSFSSTSASDSSYSGHPGSNGSFNVANFASSDHWIVFLFHRLNQI